ncbi:multidrug efflux MFS transporter [Ideonella azotifigens]|uniref:MDR family MFS transporter n=1 Tax=Ideonella azotifigens TaxID=513160 RepID=A0ABN1KGH6_9BURK|nr:MDR family MFS transporter [Ideonella azotifigens]MCD2340499.1 multidrug efflux MFS transporter [Ideonella azotifigens]
MAEATADNPPTASTPSTAAPAREPNASLNDWIAVTAGALGALMAVLDISITNSALPQVQGAIGATGTEGTWISTGYLMAEIVVIPLSAWLTRVFGLRNFLVGVALLFTLFSALCGFSTSLGMLIFARIGQGLTGGAMIPTAQTIVRTRLPRHQLPAGMTLFGLTVLLGPLLGPVIGGWLTENISWHWCFFINVPICVGLVGLLLWGLPADRAQLREFLGADWLGIAGLALGLSTLTAVLEEGQRERWFESDLIILLSLASAIGMVMVALSQRLAARPILRLSLMRNKSYASVIFIVFTVGAAFYGVSYLVPQFLAQISGYNAQQAGAVMLLSGIPAILMMPMLPRLLGRMHYSVLVIAGLLLIFGSCWLDSSLTARSAADDFTWSQLLRGLGQILAMMPLNQAAMASVAREESGDAAGLYNMARNLGGSVGLALIGTFIDRRDAFHVDVINSSVSANAEITQSRMAASAAGHLAQVGDFAHAQLQALAELAGQIRLEALVMTYSETFYALGLVMLLCVPLALLIKTPRAPAPATESAH